MIHDFTKLNLWINKVLYTSLLNWREVIQHCFTIKIEKIGRFFN